MLRLFSYHMFKTLRESITSLRLALNHQLEVILHFLWILLESQGGDRLADQARPQTHTYLLLSCTGWDHMCVPA